MDTKSEGELVIDEGPQLQLTETPSPTGIVEVRVGIGESDDNMLDYEPEEEGKISNCKLINKRLQPENDHR